MSTRRKILGTLLLAETRLTPTQLEAGLIRQRSTGARLGETLVREGFVNEEEVAAGLGLQLGLPHLRGPLESSQAAIAMVPPEEARRFRVLPIEESARTLTLAMEDPLNLQAVDDLGFQVGRRIEPVVATPSAIQEGLDRHYGPALQAAIDALPSHFRGDAHSTSTESLHRATRSAPVVRLVDTVIQRAIDSGASDIHVEETGAEVRVRYRVDGVLQQALDLPAASRHAVLSRLKVMADMDISVKRRAQDGRIEIEHAGRHLTLRVSTLPVNGGEKAVLRILDSQSAPTGLHALGISSDDLQGFRSLLQRGEGVILIAGPTGSGKSTTIFAALSEVDRQRQNVVTLEDPVEYRLPGANQVQVDARAGLGFAAALRAVLRQDPDVVMVGEIRDRETAEIAMAAAVTGHLVLSTIHTTDAPGAVTRLLNMGVPPFLVAGGLAGVLAQRLVRKACDRCRGRGCRECHEGHRGRTGVFQFLAMTDPLRDAVSRGEAASRIRAMASEAGMGSLAGDARRALAEGLTTPHEIGRLVRSASSAALPCPTCSGAVPLGANACPACGAHRIRRCGCGSALETGWHFCPWCIRRVAAVRG